MPASVAACARRACRFTIGIVIFFLSTSASAKISLDVTPLFGSTVPPGTCVPLQIRLLNDGPPVDTTLIVDPLLRYGGTRRYLYFVNLPSGFAKEVLALPFVPPGASSTALRLTGVYPHLEEFVPVTSPMNVRLVVGVGDEIGGLEFLRSVNSIPHAGGKGKYPYTDPSRPEWHWTYCRPEDVPDRAAGLTAVSILVLGSGAERLTPAQWQAIRNWVILGGVLYAPGGAGAIYLRHAKLNDILPLQNLRTLTWSEWGALETALGVEPPSGATFSTEGILAPGAEPISSLGSQARAPMMAFRPFGTGAVFFSAFNIWDKPFRGWQGLPELWRRCIRTRPLLHQSQVWQTLFVSPTGSREGAYQWLSSCRARCL